MAVAMPMEDRPYLPPGPAEVDKMIEEHTDLFSDTQCKVCSAVLISESQKLTHYQSKKHANKVRRYFSIQNEEPSKKKFKPESPASDTACNNGDTERYKVCHLCNMTFSSPVMAQSHYQGKVHAKHLRLTSATPQPAAAQATTAAPQPKKSPAADPIGAAVGMVAGSTTTTNSSSSGNPERFCTICQASLNNPLMAQQHYAGKKHKKQLTKQKLMETYGPSTSPASAVKGYFCNMCNIDLNSVEQYQAHVSGAKHKTQMKKSGMGSPKKQPRPAPENTFSTADYPPVADYQPADDYQPVDQYQSAADYQSVEMGNQSGGAGEYASAGGEDLYVATDNQYMSEGNQYSTGIPECQYT
ncbi:hypothetical protein CRUP_020605 [Coryphaenoides rupestris]|nr:hypothetical protein CRUP_020605 [Coryphaenoides rupestris]